MSDLMIEAEDLSKRYGTVQALDHVSLHVRRGEVLGFLGPNGAGKTTAMKILTCFTAPTSGSAKVNGYDILADPVGVRSSVGYLPEHTPLYQDMIVLEYLQFIARMRGLEDAELDKRIRAAVDSTGLHDVYAKEIRTLSKGYRQRVGLAQALVHEPSILILDEPMSGLDPNQAQEIRDLIKEIGKERTIILSTHNLSEVEASCGRVLIVARGKLVADSTPDKLRDRAGKGRFVLAVQHGEDTSADDVKSALTAMTGVEQARPLPSEEENELRFEVLPRDNRDLRPELFRTAVDKGYTLLELVRESQNLEQVFRDLTLAAGSPEATGSGSEESREAEKGA